MIKRNTDTSFSLGEKRRGDTSLPPPVTMSKLSVYSGNISLVAAAGMVMGWCHGTHCNGHGSYVMVSWHCNLRHGHGVMAVYLVTMSSWRQAED